MFPGPTRHNCGVRASSSGPEARSRRSVRLLALRQRVARRLRARFRWPLPTRRARTIGALALVASVTLGPAATRSAAARAAPACAPPTLNGSAALAGGAVTVSPAPETIDASYLTQISFLGVPAADITGVAVAGSHSGTHRGRLAAYAQGDGASFLPSAPFAQGEIVTVSAVLRQGNSSTPFAWRFTVAEVDRVSRSLETPPPPPPPPHPREYQHFVSSPGLRPPAVTVTANSGKQAPGDLFLAPYAGPGQYGPMILDGAGRLVWFKPLPAAARAAELRVRAADLRVQEYDGQPVLTWWQDPLVGDGRRDAGVAIANSSYREIAIVRAGNGYQTDLHAFEITPRSMYVANFLGPAARGRSDQAHGLDVVRRGSVP